MKLFFHTTLLFAASLFIFSCKTKQDQVMKNHYGTVNKYSTIENKLLIDNNDLFSTHPRLKTTIETLITLSIYSCVRARQTPVNIEYCMTIRRL